MIDGDDGEGGEDEEEEEVEDEMAQQFEAEDQELTSAREERKRKRAEVEEFFADTTAWTKAKGANGRKAFAAKKRKMELDRKALEVHAEMDAAYEAWLEKKEREEEESGKDRGTEEGDNGEDSDEEMEKGGDKEKEKGSDKGKDSVPEWKKAWEDIERGEYDAESLRTWKMEGGVHRNGKTVKAGKQPSKELLAFLQLNEKSLAEGVRHRVHKVAVVFEEKLPKATSKGKGKASEEKRKPVFAEKKVKVEYFLEKLEGGVLSLTSVGLNSQGIPLVQVYLGDMEEVCGQLETLLKHDSCGVAAVITDLPWGNASKAGYSTTVNMDVVTRKFQDIIMLNDQLTPERRFSDLGAEKADTIICALGDSEALRALETEWKARSYAVRPILLQCLLLTPMTQS